MGPVVLAGPRARRVLGGLAYPVVPREIRGWLGMGKAFTPPRSLKGKGRTMIIVITGRRGSGMTLALVRQLAIHQIQGGEVWCNIRTKFKTNHFQYLEDLVGTINRPIFLGIDAAIEFMDSRTLEPNVKARRFVEWVNRHGMTAYITTPWASGLSDVIKGNTGLTLECSFEPSAGIVTLSGDFDGSIFFDQYDTVSQPS